LWAIILGGTLARLALGATIGLGVDESYAVAVARPLSLSYYDHPPLVFWIAAAAARVFGVGHDLLLRLPFIVLYIPTTWLLYALAERLFGKRAGVITALLAQVIPVFGVSDAGWILPDGPLLFGFAATTFCLAHIALDVPGSRLRRWWLGAAAGAGIAALSKYHAVFLFAGTLLFLLTTARQRRWLARPEPYAAAVIALAMALPVVIWNAHHDWASFRFQGGRAGVHLGWHSLTALLQNLAGQAGYLLPWIWLPLAWLFVRAARRGPHDSGSWLLVCLGGGPVVVFTLVSLGGRAGLPHWPAPGWFLLLPLLGAALARGTEKGRARRVRGYLLGTTVVVVALIGFAASQIRIGWFSRSFPALFAHGDPSLDAVDWGEARAALTLPGNRPLVVTANWIDAAKLGAVLRPDAVVLCFNDDSRQFKYVADQQLLIGDDAAIVLRNGGRTKVEGERRRIAAYFQGVDSLPAQTIAIHRGGEAAAELLVFRARSLLGPYGAPSVVHAGDLSGQVQRDRPERQM
jgi:4-amino-4-deoxy-L-arabinose transferase-like glycosyltransferase